MHGCSHKHLRRSVPAMQREQEWVESTSPPSRMGISNRAWRQLLTTELTIRLVTNANPGGNITISDLELAATVAHHDTLAHYADIGERTTNNLHDNTASVYWHRKSSTTTTKAASYILRLRALHQLFHRYVARHYYLPGKMNVMADDCSRLWALSNSQLFAHFDYLYHQPNSW
jgi:hypothetical protein